MSTPLTQLLTWARQEGTAPPVLLSGEEAAMGELITSATAILLCEQGSDVACNKCHSCHLAKLGNHPDFLLFKTENKTWAIKEIRLLFKQLNRTALGKRRIVVVEAIDKVSLPAANAMLKSLEEPRPSTRFILTTRWPRRLLPTILSRCVQLRIPATPLTTTPGSDQAWSSRVVDRLTKRTRGQAISAEELTLIQQALAAQLHRQGPTPALRRAYQRLRDYYVITNQRGNEKLAQDVLLLSLPEENGIS